MPSLPSYALAPIALTMGEPAGISAEITLKAWAHFQNSTSEHVYPFFVIDHPARLKEKARDLKLSVPIEIISHPDDAIRCFTTGLPVLPLPETYLPALAHVQKGRPDPQAAHAVLASIEMATTMAINGDAAAVVTNPIQKKPLMDSGLFSYTGHTDFLGALTCATAQPDGFARGPVMLLAGADLRTVPLTVHTPLRAVPEQLSVESIIHNCLVVYQALIRDFGIANPRLAVAGLNPHAGEQGHLGDEEIHIIGPALKQLRARNIDVRGPLSADSMFHDAIRMTYDVAIAMYHDQALLPVKTIAFHQAVNITLGLPIIRTSPDHGTGLSIVAQNVARPDSLIAAIVAAARLATQRMTHDRRMHDA